MDRQKLIESVFGVAALSFLAVGCFLVLRPFLSALMWAVILCYASWPVYTWIATRLGGRRTLSAVLMTLIVAVIVVLPFVVVGLTLAENVTAWTQAIKARAAEGIPAPPEWLAGLPVFGAEVAARWTALAHGEDLAETARDLLNPLRDVALAFGATLGRGTVELALSVFIAFFVFRRGVELAAGLRAALTRLIGPRARQFLDVAGGTIQGVVYGILGTAIAQGTVAGIGFSLVAIPGALFLGFLTFFMSLIPMGPPFVWVPTVLWLIGEERYLAAVFMALWGFFLISGIDNIIRPYLISRGTQLPFILIFLGVVGGLIAFGFLGLFLGPVLLAVGYTLVLAWNRGERIDGGVSGQFPAIKPDPK